MPNILQLKKEGIIEGTFQPGDIIQFHNTRSLGKIATYLQSKLFNISARKYKKHSHSAVVTGLTLDGIPIISHMCFDGLNIQRMDACRFNKFNFSLIRAKDTEIGNSIAQAAGRDARYNEQGASQKNLTEILKKTDEKFIKNYDNLRQAHNENSNSYHEAKNYFFNLGLLKDEINPKYPNSLVRIVDNTNNRPRFSITNAFKAAFRHNEKNGHLEKYKNEINLKEKLEKKLDKDQICSQFAMNSIKTGLTNQFQTDHYETIANASAKIVPALLTEKIIQSGFILQKLISDKKNRENMLKLSNLVKNKEISFADEEITKENILTHTKIKKLIEAKPKLIDLYNSQIEISVIDLLALMRGKSYTEEDRSAELAASDLFLLDLMVGLYPLYENIRCLTEKNLITTDTKDHFFKLIHQVSKAEERQNWKTNKIIVDHYTKETQNILQRDKKLTTEETIQSSQALDRKLLGHRPASQMVKALICGIIGGFLGFGINIANTLLRFKFKALPDSFSAFSRGFIVGSSMALGSDAINPNLVGHGFFSGNSLKMESKLKAKQISDDLVKLRAV